MSVALLLFPDFALILIGAVIYRLGRLDDGFWSGLERLVYFVFFPSLLFYSTATAQLDLGKTAPMLAVGLGAFAAGVVLGNLAQPVLGARSGERALLFASGVQTSFRFNSYIALAIAGRLGGAGSDGIALMALLLGVHVPLSNAAAVYALARHAKSGVLRGMLRNPLLIATIGGLAFNFAGLHLPDFIAATLARMGSASIALGLMTVGAGLRLSGAAKAKDMIAWWLAVKLLVIPAIAWILAMHFDLPPLQRQIVVMFAGLPTASSAYILATRMGGNGPIVAFLISVGTLISIVTLPLWLLIAG